MTIVPGKSGAGTTSHSTRSVRTRRVEKQIVVALAGGFAQWLYKPRSLRWWHWQGDEIRALKLVAGITGSKKEGRARLEDLRLATIDLISSERWAVCAVARALLKRKSLTGTEIEAVIRAAEAKRHPNVRKRTSRDGSVARRTAEGS